jgi:hypothetical protein
MCVVMLNVRGYAKYVCGYAKFVCGYAKGCFLTLSNVWDICDTFWWIVQLPIDLCWVIGFFSLPCWINILTKASLSCLTQIFELWSRYNDNSMLPNPWSDPPTLLFKKVRPDLSASRKNTRAVKPTFMIWELERLPLLSIYCYAQI